MKFILAKKRPLFILLMGVMIIGIGLFQSFSRPPSQVGEFQSGLSEPIVPTPIFNPSSTVSSPEITPDPRLNPTVIPTIAPPIGISQNRFNVDDDRPRFAAEPLGYPLWEKINAAGREYPVWIIIPAIQLEAPILPATIRKVLLEGKTVDMWFAPDYFAPGWHTTSAFPGEVGNTVMSGHNNDFGEVFAGLIDLNPGDEIQIITQKRTHTYQVTNKVLFQEVEVGLTQRMENARWISPTNDERLTLVTCWPKDSNTHRLIIVAAPK